MVHLYALDWRKREIYKQGIVQTVLDASSENMSFLVNSTVQDAFLSFFLELGRKPTKNKWPETFRQLWLNQMDQNEDKRWETDSKNFI